ncbi:MAG TPA: hypothetical protein VLU46_13195, partial [Thermoanaerobaculia bacterium]|nr:hypothetical protein [Thermoanaerobaculia bacterium]
MNVLTLLLAVLSVAPAPSPANTVVLLPLDNVSGAESAKEQLAPALEEAITRHGWKVISGGEITALLEAERVRYVDTLEAPMLQKIIAATGASGVVAATVYTYNDSRNATVAVSARMLRTDGTIAWSDVAALSSEDTTRVLGFGKKTAAGDLALQAIDLLTRRLPSPDREAPLRKGPTKPLFHAAPASFRSGELDTSHPQRVCVLPFENLSSNPDASRVVADILTMRLAAAQGFEVVDAATLRAAALTAEIASFRIVSSDDLQRLAKPLGTSLFIRGTIYDFTDPTARTGGEPRLQLDLSLVDVSSGRVLWAAQH